MADRSHYRVYNIVLCGGVGSRLWPLSRKSRPKQFIPLINGQSLLQLTLKRNTDFVDSTIIIANKTNRSIIDEQVPIDTVKTIYESVPRNTAAAIAFAAFSVNPEDILLVTPSDHLIKDEDKYDEAIKQAIHLALSDKIVVFGIKPTGPETGFGYIEAVGTEVISFKEKPTDQLAAEFIEKGNYFWNSGMFCFKAGNFLSELEAFEQEIFRTSQTAYNEMNNSEISETYSNLIPSKSIDYAVIEKSSILAMVPSFFGWSDLGSFDSFSDFAQKGQSTGNNFVFSEKHVEIFGFNDLIVIDTQDALLIMPKGCSQEVKNIYAKLEIEKPELVN